jgi:hypothetical protein
MADDASVEVEDEYAAETIGHGGFTLDDPGLTIIETGLHSSAPASAR